MKNVKIIIESKKILSRDAIAYFKEYLEKYLLNDNDEIIILPEGLEIKSILYEKLNGEIEVVILREKNKEKNISKFIKSIFNKKSGSKSYK